MCRTIRITILSLLTTLIPVTQSIADILPSHGVTVGDVTDKTAVIWSRAPGKSVMHAVVTTDDGNQLQRSSKPVLATDDYTGKILFYNLNPGTRYRYRVWFSADQRGGGSGRDHQSGRFTTAPSPQVSAPVSFAWGGDLAGQNVCRDHTEGFPIFNAINRESLDLFIGLGDMIYADNVCNEIGRYGNRQIPGGFQPSTRLEDFWDHWKYNRVDPGLQKLLTSVPYYAVWDDHEVVNDFGPRHDTRDSAPYSPGVNLLPLGLKALLDYNPIAEYPNAPHRLYREVQWGKHLALFFLDNRQYRDANSSPDGPDTEKTMLGKTQLNWLLRGLQNSTATWQVIVSSVPMSIPTGSPPELGRDSWANDDANTAPAVTGIPQSETGFERELTTILKTLQKAGANAVFITTDVHFASVFRYRPFPSAPGFEVHEAVTGPLNAGLFPNRQFDKSLGAERLFFYGPETAASVKHWQEARRWMNYGKIQIDKKGVLTLSVKEVEGKTIFQTRLAPR